MTKHHCQNKLGRKGFLCLTLPHHNSASKDVRNGTQAGQKPGDRRWHRGHGRVACWLAPHSLLSLLSYRTRMTSPGMAPPTTSWNLPHQSLIKKSPYSQSDVGIFSVDSLLSDNSTLGQVDIKVAKMHPKVNKVNGRCRSSYHSEPNWNRARTAQVQCNSRVIPTKST